MHINFTPLQVQVYLNFKSKFLNQHNIGFNGIKKVFLKL
jgi:hypothetical protein